MPTWGNEMDMAGFDWTKLPDTNGRDLNLLVNVAGWIVTEIKGIRGITDVNMHSAIGPYYSAQYKTKAQGNFLSQKLIIELRVDSKYLYTGVVYDDDSEDIVRKTLVAERLFQKVKKAAPFAAENRRNKPAVHVVVTQSEDSDKVPIIKITLASLNHLEVD